MNIKVRSKLIALTLAGCCITLNSCSDIDNIEPAYYEVEDIKTDPQEEPIILPYVDKDSIDYNTNTIYVVTANKNTDIMSNVGEAGEKLGTLVEGRSFKLIADGNKDYYIIDYYGDFGFVKVEDTFIEHRSVINLPIIGKGYIPQQTYLYKTKDTYHTVEKLDDVLTNLNELEFVEIYKEYEDSYLVQTSDYNVGFIEKGSVIFLEGNLVITDISDQEVRFYQGNELDFTAPVVTGTINTSRETDKGLTNILSKWGAGYITDNAYVQCIAYFNETAEGYHTAEWRTPDEFGGDTYLTDGSHGCVNMRTDDALYLCKRLEVGDWCLVKE